MLTECIFVFVSNLNLDILYQFDFLPINERQKKQEDLLFQQVKYTIQSSSFYKKYWKEFDLHASNWLEVFKSMPITYKQDIQKENNAFIAVPISEIREITSTSGTEGTPIYIYQSKNDLNRLAKNEALSFKKMELGRNPKIQLMLTLDKLFMAGMAYYQGGQNIEACMLRSGPGQSFKQVNLLKQFRPEAIVAVPSFLLYLLENHNIADNYQEFPLKVLAIGENLKDGFGNNLPLLNYLKKHDFIELFSTYASTEMQTAFTDCKMHNGSHQHAALIYIECLDENGEEVNDGEIGELVITPLGIEGFPLLRYATGDMVKLDKEICSCGRTSPRIRSVVYRKNQRLKIKGTTLFPQDIDPIFQSFNAAQYYYIKIFTNNYGLDDFKIYLDAKYFNEKLQKQITERLQHILKLKPEVIIQNTVDFHKNLYKNDSRKPLKIQDYRK